MPLLLLLVPLSPAFVDKVLDFLSLCSLPVFVLSISVSFVSVSLCVPPCLWLSVFCSHSFFSRSFLLTFLSLSPPLSTPHPARCFLVPGTMLSVLSVLYFYQDCLRRWGNRLRVVICPRSHRKIEKLLCRSSSLWLKNLCYCHQPSQPL